MVKNKGWFKALKEPAKKCGCVFSIVGFRIWACPKHESKAA